MKRKTLSGECSAGFCTSEETEASQPPIMYEDSQRKVKLQVDLLLPAVSLNSHAPKGVIFPLSYCQLDVRLTYDHW